MNALRVHDVLLPDRKSVTRLWAKITQLFKISCNIQATVYQYVVHSLGKLWDLLGLRNCAKHTYFPSRAVRICCDGNGAAMVNVPSFVSELVTLSGSIPGGRE